MSEGPGGWGLGGGAELSGCLPGSSRRKAESRLPPWLDTPPQSCFIIVIYADDSLATLRLG